MRLMIDFEEAAIQKIVNITINNLFVHNQYNGYGELATYVRERTKIVATQLIDSIDITELIKESTLCYTKGIVEDVVKDELKKYARQAVKELKAKGQLV